MKNKLLSLLALLLLLLATACGGQALQTETAETPQANGSGEAEVAQTDDPDPEETLVTVEGDQVVTTETYTALYEALNPSVVNIQVVVPGRGEIVIETPDGEALPPDHPDFPELPFEFPEDSDLDPQTGQGSGFVFDKEGHIITNNHVIDGAEKIIVTFADGTEAEAELIGADPGSDLAVIQVDVAPDILQPVTIGDSDTLRVGELVAAIGNPFGLDGSMSTGIISGLGRLLPGGAAAPNGTRFNIPDIIQTDTAINPGNSGGPLLNLDGEVIGVNTAIQTNGNLFGVTPSFGGIGYVIPSSIVQQVVPQLIENGRIAYPWLGIAGRSVNGGIAQEMDLETDQRGVLVELVVEDSPAAAAGLQGGEEQINIDGIDVIIGGDVITQVDDEVIDEFDDLLTYLVRQTSVGQTVTLTILRDGEPMQVEVTLAERP